MCNLLFCLSDRFSRVFNLFSSPLPKVSSGPIRSHIIYSTPATRFFFFRTRGFFMFPFQTPALMILTSRGIILIISASPHWPNWPQSKSEADQLLQSPHGLMTSAAPWRERRLEHKSRTCKLRVHYDHLKILMKTYCTDDAQATYFSTMISSNAQNSKELFKTLGRILGLRTNIHLHPSPNFCEQFKTFFTEKILIVNGENGTQTISNSPVRQQFIELSTPAQHWNGPFWNLPFWFFQTLALRSTQLTTSC